MWLTPGSRYSDAVSEREVRSSESLTDDSTGTTASLVPWSRVNGGTLSGNDRNAGTTAKLLVLEGEHRRATKHNRFLHVLAQLVPAQLFQRVRRRIVREVFGPSHGLVHGGDVLDRPLPLVLVMVHDVVHATQTCREDMANCDKLIISIRAAFFNLVAAWGWSAQWPLPITPLMAFLMFLCLQASMNSSSLSSTRKSVVSAHKWAPAEWPINTTLSCGMREENFLSALKQDWNSNKPD